MQLFESDESDVVSSLFEWRSHAKSTPWRRTFCLRSILIKYSFNAGDVFYSKANRTLSIHYQQTKVVVLHLSFHWSFLINILLFGRFIYSNAFHRGWYEGRGMEKDREGEGNDSFHQMGQESLELCLGQSPYVSGRVPNIWTIIAITPQGINNELKCSNWDFNLGSYGVLALQPEG